MASLTESATRLMIFVGDYDRWQHKALASEIVQRAHDAGLAGATVLHGIEGFGAHSRVHTDRILSLAEDLPMVVVIVDADQKVRDFMPQLDEIITEGLVVIDSVEVTRYHAEASS